jgi:serine/threonine-protein kinase
MADSRAPAFPALSDRYRIERELGQGGMATVYLAHDLRHDRKVALKVLRPELSAILGAQRFLAEIKTTANLQHPHILGLFDSGEADGLVFYVMPYVEGESLRNRLTREKQLPIEESVRIAREVADALDYAHRHGVIHRDIKPENILLHEGRAMVADFGIALAAARSEGASRMTETGMSLGTPYYMSPEQAMGEREITAKSDVYALGCVLYEMLTGEPPFTGPTAQAIIARVLTEEPRSLTVQRKTIPLHVEAAVLTALAKLPADRFGTAAQFGEALAHPTATTVVTPATRRGTVRAASVTSRAWMAAPWLLALLAVAGAGWAWRERTPRAGTTWRYVTLGRDIVPSLAGGGNPIALSPDGSAMVFEDNITGSRLWLKRRGELQPTQIAGTENGGFPAYSPDGKEIAFQANVALKKVQPGEGIAVTLADSSDVVVGGSAWLDDGTVIYGKPGPNDDILLRVSASGGPSSVVLRDSTLKGLAAGSLMPLPRARGVLFTVCTSACIGLSLHVLDLRTGRQHQLLNDVATGWYLPTGQLLYVRRDGTALVAPFDLEKLTVGGPAVPVLEGVMVVNGGAYLSVSNTGTLVYIQGNQSFNESDIVRVTPAGIPSPIDSTWHGAYNSLALAPDGRRLAVGAGVASGKLSVWVKQLDNGPFTRLTFGGNDRRPAWSPDGRTIAFIRDSNSTSFVFERPVDGSAPEHLVARLDRQVQEVTWSPDGRWLLMRTDNATAGAGDIVGMRTSGDTTAVSLVAGPFTEIQPAVSPDGRWIAYTSDESGTQEIYVRPFPNTTGGRWQVSIGGGSQAAWSRDGRALYYFDRGWRMTAAQIRAGSGFEVGERRTLFNATEYVSDRFHRVYDVLPGGEGFLLIRPRSAVTVPMIVEADNWFVALRARTASR